MAFTQTITVTTDDRQALEDLVSGWHEEQAGVAPGYLGARLLADRDRSGRYVIEVDFASREEAERNNERPETQAWADKARQAVGAAEYHDYDVVRTVG